MKRVSRIVTLGLFIFILSASAALADDRICVTRYVPDWYPTIQECIDASSDCDSCLVSPGVYVENIDFQGKAITVKGDYFEYPPVIDGNQNGSVVRFNDEETEDSVLEGFTIRNGNGDLGGYGQRYGGGILCYASPTIVNCRITGNTADRGSAIYSEDHYPTIQNCMITGSTSGSEMDLRHGATITNCTIVGCVVSYGNLTITHCTIMSSPGFGIVTDRSLLTITNSIVWADHSHPVINIITHSYYATAVVRCSDIKGGEAAVITSPGLTLDWGPGNIDADPLFVGGDDYHLTGWSPCIDAGMDAGVYDDIDGDVRPIGAGFDMGSDEAPEFQPIIFDLRAYYSEGRLSLDYTIGTPVAAMWANYLILTAPSVQVIPLWSISLPAIYPPIEVPISIPFPVLGTIGIWTALFDEYGSQTIELEWVETGG